MRSRLTKFLKKLLKCVKLFGEKSFARKGANKQVDKISWADEISKLPSRSCELSTFYRLSLFEFEEFSRFAQSLEFYDNFLTEILFSG